MLFYDDVKKLFPESFGIRLPGFAFLVVSNSTSDKMEKGLYIPLGTDIDLFKSINLGAVASLWPRDKNVPPFVPNHFPLFLVENVQLAYDELLNYYKLNYNQEKWEIMTKFIFSNEIALDQPMNSSENSKSKLEDFKINDHKGGE